MMMPVQRPGQSKQDYGTPANLMRAVALKFGTPAWDLAASVENAKAENFLTAAQDSLTADWRSLPGLKWLNPPFGNIAPWAEKCARGGQILLLTPASVGANWFRDHVHLKAFIYFLNGRLTFEGCRDPYPKDCMLSAFGFGRTGYDVWDWRKEATPEPDLGQHVPRIAHRCHGIAMSYAEAGHLLP